MTEPAPASPTVHTSSRQGLADSVLGTRNLMTVAALSVVGMVLLIPLNYTSGPLAATPGGIVIGCAIMGLWVIPYLLPAAVVRRPGAATIAALIMGIISVFTTPAGPTAIVGNLIGGLFIEVPLAVMLYRFWTWWSLAIAAAVFGLLNGIMYLTSIAAVAGFSVTPLVVPLATVSALAGAGITILLTRLLNRAGIAVDHHG